MTRDEHLYTIAGEEGVEIAQRCSKAVRFGGTEVQPGQGMDNRQRILQEFADLVGVLELLGFDIGIPAHSALRPWIDAKKEKVEKFLAYSRECGTLEPAESSAVPDELEAAKRAMDEYVPSTSDEPLAKRISDEMHDYMAMAHEVSKVYDTLTVGFFSKPNTAAHHVIARVEEIQQKDIDEAVAEALGETAESRAVLPEPTALREALYSVMVRCTCEFKDCEYCHAAIYWACLTFQTRTPPRRRKTTDDPSGKAS